MSLSRRSHGPADVIPHVWRCHCRPERTLSKSVHSFTSCRGAIYPCFSYELTPLAILLPNSTPVHPQYCAEGAEKREPIAPRIRAQSYGRSYSALRLCTLSCESRDPMSRGKPQRGKESARRPSNNRRATAHSADQQEAVRRGLRILARMIARRSPAASGAPVRGCAGAAGGGRGRRLSGSREPASSLQTMLSIHARKPHRHFVHFRPTRRPTLCPLS